MRRNTDQLKAGGNPRRAVALFMAAGLGALLITAALGFVIAQRTATQEAIRDARELTVTDARSVAPLLEDGLIAGDPRALAPLDRAVRQQVLSGRVVRVKLWNSEGRIVYSDDARLIGRRYPLGHEEAATLRSGGSDAEISDLQRAENQNERHYGKLLEVYQGVRTRSGTKLLFEVYLRFGSVTANGRRVLQSFAPALVAGLVVLWLAQLPLAIGLARRVRRGHLRERELLLRAIESSDQERRRIAADLHDSVVQGLAGSSMSLTAVAADAQRAGREDLAERVQRQASALRQWVRELRTLLVSIAPPRLHEEGLALALADLASAAKSRGVAATIAVTPGLELNRTAEALVFRGAQEALRNTLTHAQARTISLSVTNGGRTTRLEVTDDGVGFDPSAPANGHNGHVGLRLLGELTADAGGNLTVDSAPGRGTTVILEVPNA